MNQLSLVTVKQLAAKQSAFSEASLRWFIFQANRADPGPYAGLRSAIHRVGSRRLIIDEKAFIDWVLSSGFAGGCGGE